MSKLHAVALAAGLLVVAAPHAARACLWDDDTLKAESEGLADVLTAAIGGFERSPPLYYELRLQRAVAAIAADPDALAAYDNAGVACERLGRSAEAIAWMEKKGERLASHPEATEHAYRMHANLGTFLAHDWVRRGANRADMAEMQRGRDEIAEALRINPDAHFGRERVQLAAMDWIMSPPPLTREGAIPDLLGLGERGGGNHDDDAKGLAGLVLLGSAWESVDVFHTLSFCFRESASMRRVVNARLEELVAEGRRSLHPAAAPGDGPAAPLTRAYGYELHDAQAAAVTDWFHQARAAADDWNARRTAYMLPLLAAGRHPDWDPSFWQGFSPKAGGARPVPPPMPSGPLVDVENPKVVAALIALGATSFLVCVALAVRAGRRGARAAAKRG